MKRFLLPLMAISISLISCSRDNDDVTNPIENPVAQAKKTTGITRTFEHFDHNGGGMPFLGTYFEYDGDRLKNINHKGNLIFHYNGDKISAIEVEEGTSPVPQRVEFTYNTDGTLKSSLQKETSNPDMTLTHEYNYINTNTIKVKEVRKYNNSNYESIKEYTLTMSRDNLVRKEVFDREYDTTTIHEYLYDSNKSPLRDAKGMAALSVAMHLIRFHYSNTHNYQISSFRNNVVSETVDQKHTYSSITTRLLEVSYQYHYNKEGYPTRLFSAYNDSTYGEHKEEYIYNY